MRGALKSFAKVWLLVWLCPLIVTAQTATRSADERQPCSTAVFDAQEAKREFAAAASKYHVKYERLIRSRGEISVYRDVPDGPETSLDTIKDALAERFVKGTSLLFYDYEEDLFRVWLIGQDGIRAYHEKTLPVAQLESAIAEVRESLDVDEMEASRLPPRLRPKRIASTAAPRPKALLARRLNKLTSLLLPADIACSLSNTHQLIIVPILNLGTVPFAALRPFASSTSLIDIASITIAPSLFDVNREVTAWAADFSQPLFVGNPYLAPSAGWEPLQNAEREAKAIAQMFKTTALIGREATKGAVIARAANSDLLYFATHGAADASQPLDGGFLVFSGPNESEGLWTAREIQHTPLQARLAVLSACQTGLGKTHDAGIIGLARAFQLAGVPRVVMSLWSVYDDATAELMQAFARHLRSHAPAEALRQAMLDVRKRRPNPAEWASFVIFGTPQ